MHLRHWIFGLPSSQPLARVAGHRPLVPHPRASRTARASSTSSRSVRDGSGEWIEDPLNPNRARDPFGANSVAARRGLRGPRVDRRPTPRRARARSSAFVVRQQGVRRARGAARSTCRRASAARAAIRCSSSTTASDYLHFAGMKTVLDNLIHRLEIPDMIVALTDSPDRLREYANDERHAHFLTEELLPRARAAALPLDRRAAGALPHGRELRRGRGARRPRGATPASSAGCCCSRARSRSPTSARATAAARSSTRSSSS